MEAISFRHYLENQTLISPEESQEKLDGLCPSSLSSSSSSSSSSKITLLLSDYLLGIYDMTGELMKLAITVMASGGHVSTSRTKEDTNGKDERMKILSDMRELRIYLENLNILHSSNLGHDVSKKMDVMRTSVEKVENAFYGLTVRGAERPNGWMPDDRNTTGIERLTSY
jgi:predicted translin family RNA/ssDNA-binding protein